jgi:hypothetical protein
MNAISKFLAIAVVFCLADVAKAQYGGVYPDPHDTYLHSWPLSAPGEYEWVRENRAFFEALYRGYQLSEEQFFAAFREIRRAELAYRKAAREASDNENAAKHRTKDAARDEQRAAEAFGLIEALRSGAVIRPVGLDAGWVAERMDEAEAMLLAGGPLDGAERLRLAAIAAELRLAVNEQQFDDFDQRAEAMHVVVLLEYVAENADSMLLAGM